MNLNNVLPIDRLTQIRLSSSYPLEKTEFSNNFRGIIKQLNSQGSRILQKFITIKTENGYDEIYTKNADGSTTTIAKYTRVDERKILYAFVVYIITGREDYRVYLKSYFDTQNYKNVFGTLTKYIGINLTTFKNVLNTPNTIPDDTFSTSTFATTPPPQRPPSVVSISSSPGSSPGTSQQAQNLQNIMPQQPSPGQQQAPSGTLTPPITTQQTTSTS